jgi:hypothetical protein
MDRKQRACIVAGFFLLLLSLLFPPSRGSGYYSPTSYRFLLSTHEGAGIIEFSRLFLEWMLIALVTTGLFHLLRESTLSKPETRTNSVATSEHTWRRLFSLSIVLYGVIAALCLTNYFSLRKIRRLERGTQNVKQMVLATLNTVHKQNMSLISLYDTSPVDFVQDPTEGQVWSPRDMSQVDTLSHPTLGVLPFPHSMPWEERVRLIDRAVLAQEPLRRIKEALDKLQ